MSELAYAPDHPAHPDNAGKAVSSIGTPWTNDYMPDQPARGGAGQAVPITSASFHPRDGFKHLFGLPGNTLREAERAFSALPPREQEARLKWNEDGIPADAGKE